MKMGFFFLFILFISVGFSTSNQCSIGGPNSDFINIQDITRGVIFERTTTNIQSIQSYAFSQQLNAGPYFTLSLVDSRFVIETSNNFEHYEENETLLTVAITATFSCLNGPSEFFMLIINISDTNNNAPVFLPSDEFTYIVQTPFAAGLPITGCFDAITARDIDLTTQRIDFTIEENPYFEIDYDEKSSTTPREFIGILRSTAFIRDLLEPITLKITATDVDLTGDPPLTAVATVTFIGNTTFTFPENPVFSQPFYFAEYTMDHQVVLSEPIFLQSGFDDLVNFTLHGDLSENFELVESGQQVRIQNRIPLEIYNLRETQVILVVRANREGTTGDRATIIVQLPEGISLQFEQSSYRGTIVNNILPNTVLPLLQGYEGEVISTEVLGENSQFFTTNILGNSIQLTMNELPANVIAANNIISLEVVASSTFNSASTIVILEIIRDDDPIFSSALYTGMYETETGLTHEPITLTQGYDETIVTLSGDHSNHFQATRDGAIVTIRNTLNIPPSIFYQQNIFLTMHATRPLAVGASTAIVIKLPAGVQLEFEQSNYRGTIQNNVLQNLVLTLRPGYEGEVVNTEVLGDNSQFFTTSIQGNSVQLTMNVLPANVIAENNIISIEVVASSAFSRASTIVVLEIIRVDNPIFSSALYTGSYATETGLTHESITFTQGYDGTIVSLSGDHSNHFEATREGAVVTIRNVTSIPPSIFNQQHILLTLHATRPLTVGASTAIVITLPAGVQLEFEQSNYRGTIENNILQELVLPLMQGYEGVVVNSEVLGEHSQFFSTSIQGNSVQLTMNELPADVIAENNIISLEVVASSAFSRATTIVILEIIRVDNPIFSSVLYTGSYATETGLTHESIIFTQGYDGTTVSLSGDHSNHFEATRAGAVVTIRNVTSIPPSIFNQQHILLTLHAARPLTVGASTAIVITLPAGVQLEFEQSNYRGTIENNILQELVLPLMQGYEGVVVNSEVLGEHSQFFSTSIQGNSVQLTMNELPANVIAENNIISLEVVASSAFSRATTIVVLEIIRDENVTPVFSSPLYRGSYETETGLIHEPIIFTQGYDATVLSLSGDHSNHFEATREGAVVTIRNTTSVPPSIFNQQHILLTLHATTPLTMGASTAIIITLPEGVSLEFEQSSYHGTIRNNILQELVLPLVQGYQGEIVDSEVLGEHWQFFSTRIQENSVHLTMNELPANVIAANNIISLEVVASSAFSRATTIVVLEIVRNDDHVTPVFSSPLYRGSYETETGLTHEPITITQGYDEITVLSLSGDHSNHFEATREGAVVTIRNVTSVPPSIFNQQHILLTLHATTPLTIGASAAIVITLPEGVLLEFEQSSYHGTIRNNILQELVLPLVQGYQGEIVNSEILGEYWQFFSTRIQENSIHLTMNELPNNVIATNNIISLEVVASSAFSRATTIVVLEIVRNDDHVIPVFSSPLYRGSYETETGLTHEPITITQGYDEITVLSLSGDHSNHFEATREGAVVTIRNTTSVPPSIFNQQHILLTLHATTPLTIGASTAIVITLPEGVLLEFEQSSYHGTIRNNILQELVLPLVQGYQGEIVDSEVLGEHSQFFFTSIQGNSIQLTMNELPANVIAENNIISLEVVASSAFSRATTIVVLEIVRNDDHVTPVFSSPLYRGSYETETGLTHEPIIITQGYDEITVLSLSGDHSNHFEAIREGAVVTIRNTTSVPPSIFNQQHILLTLHATRPLTAGASTAIVINLPAGISLEFEQSSYHGRIKNNNLQGLILSLIQGYEEGVINTEILGEYSQFFYTNIQGNSIELRMTEIPDGVIALNNFISLEVVAISSFSNASAIVILEIVRDDHVVPIFSSPLYRGSYSAETGLSIEPIIFTQGYHETVGLSLSGDHSNYFEATREGPAVIIRNTTSIPPSIFNQQYILLFLQATRPQTVGARTAIVITLPAGVSLEFEQPTYLGTIRDNSLQELVLSLTSGYHGEIVNTEVLGEYSQFFNTAVLGNSIVLTMNEIPNSVIALNNIISLEVVASSIFSRTSTIVILEIIRDDNPTLIPIFSSPLHTGSYEIETGLTLEPIILTQGFDEATEVSLSGDHSSYFEATRERAIVTIRNTTSIPPSVFNQQHILLFLHATRPQTVEASTAIVITLPAGVSLEFAESSYLGIIKNNILQELFLYLTPNYEGEIVDTEVIGEYSQFFSASIKENTVQLILLGELPDNVISENNIIALQVVAFSNFNRASTIVILRIVRDDDVAPLFSSPLYRGSYQIETGLTHEPITLTQGYHETIVSLSGDHSSYFEVAREEAVVAIRNIISIPPSLFNQQRILLTLHATRPLTVGASTAIVITLPPGSEDGNVIAFERLVYEGTIQLNTVQHEPIIIKNHDGVNVIPYGQYANLFIATVSNGEVTIRTANEILTLPSGVTRVVLELHAGDARAVLILTVIESDVPVPPTVTFSRDVYVFSVGTMHTGLIGTVLASVNNEENIIYSLNIDNEHLLARISINQEGQLHLFAPANSGVYEFQVIATTDESRTTATTKVHLTVQAISNEGDDINLQPLIILNRKEEEPHHNLVRPPIGAENCKFTLNNRWPLDQEWLYVDENGLHTKSIDREHESIAFMALSQIQVELILTCDTDNVSLKKRSRRSSWLGPYNYNEKTWILSESIPFNPRRSLVNLIVEDINDNYPIFVGKENEPIVVGYPVYELEDRILPRSLAELQATDADIGENAALIYWSPEEALAVSPNTGFVHVRTGAQLQNNQILMVHATDQYGEGLTGNIQILVKLLTANNIAVVTVENAFLDDEKSILTQLSTAIGYELGVLRSIVISDSQNLGRMSRNTPGTNASGASLLLYVYGLVDNEPVSVGRLTVDINNNAAVASVISTVSLEDLLVPVEIIVTERDIGFFVATIVLSVLLLLIIALATIWFYLKRRNKNNYEEFSDKNSLASGSDSLNQVSKPETPKSRLNIEELKKSEQRLQDRLNTPMETVTVEPIPPKKETSIDDIADLLSPESNIPIVIQSVDKLKDAEETDDDEFGEKVGVRRKSVVTFNENVEKIIHLQNDTDSVSSTSAGYEVFKL